MNKIRLGAIAIPATFAMTASLVLALPAAAAQPTAGPPPATGHYSKISVPGGTQVQPEGINDSGVIVGCYQAKTSQRAFIDRHGKFSTFADPAVKGKHGATCALGVDDAGVIVGYYRDAGAAVHGFVDRNGRFTSLTAPAAGRQAGQGTVADGINRSGVVVGYYRTGQVSKQRGFVLKKGKFSTVDVPLSGRSHPPATVLDAIADDGAISGGLVGPGHPNLSFIERAGKFTTIAVPKGFETEIDCVSEHGGFAVGTFQPTKNGSGISVGFTYRAGVYRSLRDPSAPRHTVPQCGNNAGFVVGYLANGSGIASQGFLFTPVKAAG